LLILSSIYSDPLPLPSSAPLSPFLRPFSPPHWPQNAVVSTAGEWTQPTPASRSSSIKITVRLLSRFGGSWGLDNLQDRTRNLWTLVLDWIEFRTINNFLIEGSSVAVPGGVELFCIDVSKSWWVMLNSASNFDVPGSVLCPCSTYMDSRGKLLFDLNEVPDEGIEEIGSSTAIQPQSVPFLSTGTTYMFSTSRRSPFIVNEDTFSHASSVSGFQPFVRRKVSISSVHSNDQEKMKSNTGEIPLLPNIGTDSRKKVIPMLDSRFLNSQDVDREEGEWSDGERSANACASNSRYEIACNSYNKASEDVVMDSGNDFSGSGGLADESSSYVNNHSSAQTDMNLQDVEGSNNNILDANAEADASIDSLDDRESVSKRKELKGVEASYALKCANNIGKKHNIDQQKQAMLGKKRNRQTMFLNLEGVKEAGAIKSSTPKRQMVSSRNSRLGEWQNGSFCKDQNLMGNEDHGSMESNDGKSESNNEINSGRLARSRRSSFSHDPSTEGASPSFLRQNLKQPAEPKAMQNIQAPQGKPASYNHGSVDTKPVSTKKNPPKKQTVISSQYQDSSIERLLREVTSEKFWHHPEETELQCVPGQFESVEEYVRVFEPLLFEECRAQLYSTWEEANESASRDVRVKSVERRERGWYDIIILPASEAKLAFKEGDVAVLSSLKLGSVRSRRTATPSSEDNKEPDNNARVVGTIRRHIPVDTRDPPGATLHFFVGDSYDGNSSDHILKKLEPRSMWVLTVLGTLATTQREYVGLHAFRRLNSQMQGAILQPSPDHFPNYEEQSPVMPECFTPNFVEHLHRTFNSPQLAAIHWAATHTAAGTNNGSNKKQDLWPFTLVQGPPGTGKTHTVWGMLNVIHLIQYQHYYTALLKKLAPESYKQSNESNTDSIVSGSIDEVLQNMDQDLFRTLPKLCPKPRMLVCAPSNAATDELLTRVLDRGFIDGEMKVYRPDVARVGVDTQTRAAQAVSVERRTELLLVKGREEIYGWLQQLRGRETHLAHQIATLQRQLNAAAAAGRSQGSVGVDPDILMARDQNRDALLQNLAAVVESRDKVLVEMSRLLILERKFRPNGGFNLEEARASLEASFANEAEIVFTTLSSSGRKLFSRLTHGFDMVVIDEAAQASEVAILPPLSLGAARCVLVGDPQQLPATVISKAAGTLLYSRSLFERFQQAGCPTMLLTVQYRMHPQIRDFPSRHFYQGRLTDSESVTNCPDEKYYQDPLLRPYIFYDILHGRESQRGGSVSYQNLHEAQFCRRLYEHLRKTTKSLGLGKVSVGIITPYKLQLKFIRSEFEDILNSEDGRDLYINTVDAFQGQERDVIIMSCVRASGHGVGFVADIRRMNVALTRAKRALWVMGNASSLMLSEDWAVLIADAKSRNCYMDMDSLPKDFLAQKEPFYAPPYSSKFSSVKMSRQGGSRSRSSDTHMEAKQGPVDEQKPNGQTGVLKLSSIKLAKKSQVSVKRSREIDDIQLSSMVQEPCSEAIQLNGEEICVWSQRLSHLFRCRPDSGVYVLGLALVLVDLHLQLVHQKNPHKMLADFSISFTNAMVICLVGLELLPSNKAGGHLHESSYEKFEAPLPYRGCCLLVTRRLKTNCGWESGPFELSLSSC
ncbi:putative ATP-dependent helicase C29A10.10c, partial [Drosera capensis]